MNSLWNAVRHVSRLTLFLLLLCLPFTAQAGPWSKSAGGVYAKLGAGFFTSDSFMNSEGILQKGNLYLGTTTSLYFEIGLFKNLQIQGSLPYLIATNYGADGARFTQGSFGDGFIGFQYQIPIPGPLVLALVANAKLPMYDLGRLSKKSDVAANASSFPAQGGGQLDLTFWLSVGGALQSLPIFMYLDLGYRHRTEVFFGDSNNQIYGDSFQFFGQIGYTVWKKQGMILSLNVQGTIPFEVDQVTKGLFSVGLGVYLPVIKSKAGTFAIELGIDPLLWARNAGPGLGWSVGFSFNR